jgi:AcrR family transcriptional regulator
VPRLWNDTIEAHRHQVRAAILDTTAALVTEKGLLAVTMSEIAERAGIGRATLYNYFPDVEAILLAWHERGITAHLDYLAEIRDRTNDPVGRLAAVLEAYALIDYEHHGSQAHQHHLRDRHLEAVLHKGGHVARANEELHAMIRDLIVQAVPGGDVRDDVAPAELASYCLHALSAANSLTSKAAVRRLVEVTLAGLRKPH